MKSLLKHTGAALFFTTLLAAIGAIGFATDLLYRYAVRSHPDGAALADNFSWMLIQWGYMFPALLIGVGLAMKLPPVRPRTFFSAMACIQGLVIVRTQLFAPPHPVPAYLWTQTLLVVPIIFCSGFWFPMRRRWEAHTTAA